MFKFALCCNEFVMRCSLHALSDPVEIKTFYDDLTTTGKQMGVPMPVMDGYARDIADFVHRSVAISGTQEARRLVPARTVAGRNARPHQAQIDA
jgi:hypothetical protein